MEHPGTPLRNTKNRSWCFTWNNYLSTDIIYLQNELKEQKYIFGEEKGNTGTPHLQGVVNFKSPRSFKSVRKLFKNNHIEVCRNWQASKIYCSKDGETYTNIERCSTRKERLLKKYDNIIWKPWQQNILNIIDTEPNDRTINWIHEPNGNIGKSFLAKYIVMKHDAIIADGKKENIFNQIKIWIDNHKDKDDPTIIILDIPRYNEKFINYGMLEQVKNGMIYSGKYEGGICLFESPHVFIFSNNEPEMEYMSEDRWNIINVEE